MKFKLLFIVVNIVFLLSCTEQAKRSPDVFEFPKGYIGSACIEDNRPDCAPTLYEKGKWVYRFPDNGYICTSSNFIYGRAKDEYYYVDGSNRKQINWELVHEGGFSKINGKIEGTMLHFRSIFIGTLEERDSEKHKNCSDKVKNR